MKPGPFVAVGLVLVVLLAGCASARTPSVDAGGPPANVSGSWSGFTGGGGTGAAVTLVLNQSGAAVTGTIDVGGRADLRGPLTGTVSGSSVKFKLASAFGSSGQLRVSQDNTITGVVGGQSVALRRN
jgi:hypothetical protein